jgi:hypothetical protein
VADAIRELERRGRVTPDRVIEAARDPASPLHRLFNWNIEQAALEHWRQTAREIINRVTVVIRTEKIVLKCPAYVRDPAMPPRQQGYVAVSRLRSDEEMSREAIIQEFSRAHAHLQRAREIAVGLGQGEVVDQLIEGVEKIRDIIGGEVVGTPQ